MSFQKLYEVGKFLEIWFDNITAYVLRFFILTISRLREAENYF